MPISRTEPSSVISKKKFKSLKVMSRKYPIKLKQEGIVL